MQFGTSEKETKNNFLPTKMTAEIPPNQANDLSKVVQGTAENLLNRLEENLDQQGQFGKEI